MKLFDALLKKIGHVVSPSNSHILLDAGSRAILARTSSLAAAVLVSEFTIDSRCITFWELARSKNALEVLSSLQVRQLPEWSWNTRSRALEQTVPDVLTDALRARSRLAQAKADALSEIINVLNTARLPLMTGFNFQETVYLMKKAEAANFKDAGYDESHISEFPFVLQYADFAGISFKQAADDILFKASLDDGVLEKTELLRLTYFNRVRKAVSPDELSIILADFKNDAYLTAFL